VTVLALAASTVIYWSCQRSGSDDPFAVELVAWWVATDLLFISGVLGREMTCSSPWITEHARTLFYVLAIAGLAFGHLCITLSQRQKAADGSTSYTVWPESAIRPAVLRYIRPVAARSLSGGYASLHLALFLS
jgi:hypothetical protein